MHHSIAGLSRSLRIFLRHKGINVVPTYLSPSLQGFIHRVRKEKFKIDVVYDIGAFKGNWTRAVKKHLGYYPKFFLFEPNSAHNEDLEKVGERYFNELLSKEIRPTTFYQADGLGDSIYPQNNLSSENFVPVEILSNTIDNIVSLYNLPSPDLVKIDTQGSELDILEGGRNTLREAKLIILECPLVQFNRGAPDISQYLSAMQNLGFIPWSTVELHLMLNVFVQIDIAFINKKFFESYYGDTKHFGFI